MKTVIIGADHRGFRLKESVEGDLRARGYDVLDVGNQNLDDDDDYTDFALKVAEEVASRRVMGVAICGSGVGVCVAANKVRGVRAGMGLSAKQVRKSREDDDINVLCLSSDFVDEDQNNEMVTAFLETLFSAEERQIRRINKIKKYENIKIS